MALTASGAVETTRRRCVPRLWGSGGNAHRRRCVGVGAGRREPCDARCPLAWRLGAPPPCYRRRLAGWRRSTPRRSGRPSFVTAGSASALPPPVFTIEATTIAVATPASAQDASMARRGRLCCRLQGYCGWCHRRPRSRPRHRPRHRPLLPCQKKEKEKDRGGGAASGTSRLHPQNCEGKRVV